MISIAMTTYNGEKYVRKQIASLLNQTVMPDEIIICDDCSTDGTRNILQEIKEHNNSSCDIRLEMNKENLGYTENFKKAISMTKGDLIFLADQDDVWHCNKLEEMQKVMKEKKCSAVCCDFDLIDGNDNPIPDKNQYRITTFEIDRSARLVPISFNRLVYGNVAQGCCCCFNKEVKEKFLAIDSSELIHDHQIMFISSLLKGVWYLNEELIDYRLHQNNSVGFSKKSDRRKIEIKKPSHKPFMVQFLDDVSTRIHIPFKWYYSALYYLRIPYFVSKLKK